MGLWLGRVEVGDAWPDPARPLRSALLHNCLELNTGGLGIEATTLSLDFSSKMINNLCVPTTAQKSHPLMATYLLRHVKTVECILVICQPVIVTSVSEGHSSILILEPYSFKRSDTPAPALYCPMQAFV